MVAIDTPEGADQPDLSIDLHFLYVKGLDAEADSRATELLSRAPTPVRFTSVGDPISALTELTQPDARFQGLVTSPTLDVAQVIKLIATVRSEQLPTPIVALCELPNSDFYATAVGAGADAVLPLSNATEEQVAETLGRVRRSQYYRAADAPARLRLLYVGTDWLVWKLLEVLPFARSEKASCASDGSCPIRSGESSDGGLRCDAVLVDERPGQATVKQVLRWIKTTAPKLPVLILSRRDEDADEEGLLELGAEEVLAKTGIYRPRLITALRRVHQMRSLTLENAALTSRSAWLREVFDELPDGVVVVKPNGSVSALNRAARGLLAVPQTVSVVNHPFVSLLPPDGHGPVSELLSGAVLGQPGELTVHVGTGPEKHEARLQADPLRNDTPSRRSAIVRVTLIDDPRTTADAAAGAGRLHALEAARDEAATERDAIRLRFAEAEHAWDAKRAQLQAQLDELKRKSTIDVPGRATFETRIADLQETATAALAERARAERTLSTVRTELDSLTTSQSRERATWKAQREELDARIAELEQAAAEPEPGVLEARLRETEAARDGAERAAQERQSSLDLARQDAERRREEADNSRAAVEQALSELRAELDTAKRTAEEQGAARTAAEGRAAEANQAREEADRQRELADRALADREQALTDLRAELDRTAKAARDEHVALEACVRELEQRVDQASAARDEAERCLTDLRAESAYVAQQTSAAHSALDRRIRELEGEAGEASRARADAEQSLEAAHTELVAAAAAADATREALDSRIAELVGTAAAAAAAREMAEAATATVQQELADTKAKHDDLRVALTSADHDLERARLEHARQSDQWTAERDALHERVARIEDEHARLVTCDLFGYAETSAGGHLVRCNDRFARIFGYADADDAISRTAALAFPGLGDPERLADLPASGGIRRDVCSSTADGDRRFFTDWVTCAPAAGGTPEHFEHVLLDVTHHALQTERLRLARRLESVGALAATMSVDLQPLLAIVTDRIEHLAAAVPHGSPEGSVLNDIARESGEAERLVRQLLTFSRRQQRPLDRVQLADILEQAGQMLSALAGPDIEFELQPADAGVVTAVLDDLEQLLTTLVVSARNLLPMGGRIVVAVIRPGDTAEDEGPVRPVRLQVTAEGYQVQRPTRTAELEQIVGRCDGVLHISEPANRRVAYAVDLPTECAEPPRRHA